MEPPVETSEAPPVELNESSEGHPTPQTFVPESQLPTPSFVPEAQTIPPQTTPSFVNPPPVFISSKSEFSVNQAAVRSEIQNMIDRTAVHVKLRWIAFVILLFIYFLRVYTIGRFYIVTYALGIYLLNLLIGFLSPKVDPALMDTYEDDDSVTLPSQADDEFKPFIRKLPEFTVWLSGTKAVLIALTCTLFRVLDLPVYYPILIMYFCLLMFITLKQRIRHMIRYKYVPFSIGKKTYKKVST
eukprot:GCRY01002344.1.p1 GENE.GCRY01002344.1~~GCRY01002344.1.p1  ORF type:complete len:242 (+),score=26.34 GCRY01002344.1:136-861(+)